MITFLGISRIEFQDRKTGNMIKGYKIHFAEPVIRGVGQQTFSEFMSDDMFFELFGPDMNKYKDKCGSQPEVIFSRNGHIQSIKFK